jgi:hypothetical protein
MNPDIIDKVLYLKLRVLSLVGQEMIKIHLMRDLKQTSLDCLLLIDLFL